MTVTLREMHWIDFPRLVELEQQLFAQDAWSHETWWSELAGRPRRAYAVAESDGVVVGYAGVDRSGDVADVMTIAVAPDAQGQRLGQVLLDWMESEAGGAEALLLEVRADNAAARKLYDRNGFEQINVRRRYYQPGDVDALILRKLLDGGAR